jgi:hypothetical protein
LAVTKTLIERLISIITINFAIKVYKSSILYLWWFHEPCLHFEASVSKYSGNRIALYPPNQERLRKFHGERVEVLIVIEGD